MELIMLGTGNAMVTRCYNTCFALKRDESYFLVDAGVSNIAQFIKSVYPKTHKGYYDFDEDYAYLFKIDNNEDTTAWSYVIEKYNKYCKNTRKDCMFIADGLRPLCLNGNEKL